MVKLCCVKGCSSEGYAGCGISFFKFPNNENLQQRWLEVVPLKKKHSSYSVVCSRHFKSEDIITHTRKSILKPEAIPSIFPIEISTNKQIHVLRNITVRSAQEKVEAGLNKLQIQKQTESISALPEIKENLEPTPGTSMEPPLKKFRQEDIISNLVVEKDKLKYKVKLLSQRLKRRDIKINNLKSALNVIKKKCTNFEEVESVLVNNFSNIHMHMNTRLQELQDSILF